MKEFNISLEFQGLCLFDPKVLTDFLSDKGIYTKQVFDYFINNPEIGKKVINEGVILPIYSIPELNYKIICSIEDINLIPKEWEVFNIKEFGLKVRSNTIIISDIYNIMNWDEPDFFLTYQENYQNKTDSNDYFELENGFYNINIIGFREADSNKSPFDLEIGYKFIFKKVEKLNIDIHNKNIDDINYNVVPEELF